MRARVGGKGSPFQTPLYSSLDAHVGGVNDLAFSHPNKQLCVVTCGDDKTIKVVITTCFISCQA